MSFNWAALTPEEEAAVLSCADNSRMSEAEPAVLCEYAALDTEATWLFWQYHLKPQLQRFETLKEYHSSTFMNLERLLIVQELNGLMIERKKLSDFHTQLSLRVINSRRQFLEYPPVAQAVKFLNQGVLKEHLAAKPTEFKKPEVLGPEPDRYTKAGKPSSKWESWENKRKRLAEARPEPTKHFIRWEAIRVRLEAAIDKFSEVPEDEAVELGLFNLRSPDQKIRLFYGEAPYGLGFPVLVWTNPDEGKEARPSVDADAMRGFGEAGKLLTAYMEVEKLKQMTETLLEKSSDGYLHPQFKVPGTHTGRLGGSGGINCQNFVKDKEFLSCFVARPGCVLLESDAAALEPHVLTALSRDHGMLQLYGKEAKPHDVYCFVGMSFPGIREKFAAAGYSIDAPTKEAIKRIKAEYSKERQVCKLAMLSAGYGAGAAKWQSTFALEGIQYTLPDCKKMHLAYWDLFSGVKEWGLWLQAQWNRNGGWFLDGLGMPCCVDKLLLKDSVNRSVQRTGHAILLIKLQLLVEELTKAGIPFHPWMVDMHDEYFFEIPIAYGNAALAAAHRATERLNLLLNNEIKIKFEPQIITCWAQAKD